VTAPSTRHNHNPFPKDLFETHQPITHSHQFRKRDGKEWLSRGTANMPWR